MESFRIHLKQELARRLSKNPNYSLRAFARNIGISHATLSTLLSGKRKITPKSVVRISTALGLSPKDMTDFINHARQNAQAHYHLIEEDTFSLMSEWYFDAILELTLIKNFKLDPRTIAPALGISVTQASSALETLLRLNLLSQDEWGEYRVVHQHSSNILNKDQTTAAQKKYQKSVLDKSAEALESIDRRLRDHTSTTMAINTADLPRVKDLIKKFRYDLNEYLQREAADPNEVYQLQVSFFPLSKSGNCNAPE